MLLCTEYKGGMDRTMSVEPYLGKKEKKVR